ncbi:Myb-like DNA-binding domain [Olea europaea subsp. europaea]|uniref:Myb-like DNA-binding domain n=1 Tax=Olea europaea subsp. europaea TaxID=158383 RepID=A0A8S0R1L2_OLEEU|nr:Myb-like DNA-binding domain [Olea europaea subsp. europaea]
MATSSEAHKQGSIQVPGSILRNGNSVPELNNGAVPTLKYQKQISTEWTPEEQSILEEGLAKYATHSMIVCYAKIAVQLKKKTVCDVALRCRWMTVKEASKRRKGDLNVRRKSKGKMSRVVKWAVAAAHGRMACTSGRLRYKRTLSSWSSLRLHFQYHGQIDEYMTIYRKATHAIGGKMSPL